LGAVVLASSYLRELTLARTFGATRALDVYLIALTLPQAIGLEAANIALALQLPRYAGAFASVGYLTTDRLRRDLGTWAAALTAVTLVLVGLAPVIAAVLAPGLSDREQADVATALRILATLPPLLGLAGLARAWLDAQGHVWIGAGLPSLRPLGVVVGVLLASTWGAATTLDIVLGIVSGAALGLVLHVTAAFHFSKPGRVAPEATPGDEPVRRSLGLLVGGAALSQSGDFVDKSLGSTTGPGQVAALNYATMVLTIPMTILVNAVATVALPEFARLRGTGAPSTRRAAVSRYGRGLAVIVLPVTALLVLWPQQVITALLGARNLGPGAVATASACLAALALGQVFYVIAVVFRQQLIAHQRYGTLLGISGASLTVKAAASVALLPSLGVVGLALATTAGSAVAFALMLATVGRRSPPSPAD
jgi:putative peptidoglycan lipid II flippase